MFRLVSSPRQSNVKGIDKLLPNRIRQSGMHADAASNSPGRNRPAPGVFLGRWQRPSAILGLFFISRLLVLLSAQVAWNHFAKTSDSLPPHHNPADLFNRADAAWYVSVARDGYHYAREPVTGVADGNLGFYPVFPFFVRIVHLAVPDWLTAGHLVANTALLIACFLLWELAERELGSPTAAGWAVAFALFCPGAAWLSMVFSESSFLLLFLVVMLSCRRRRWLAAAVAGYFLALTRTVGVLACVFVAVEVLTDWLELRRGASSGADRPTLTPAQSARWLLAMIAPVLGYATFLLFMQVHFVDGQAQHNSWANRWPDNAHVAFPWTAIMRDWKPMHNSKRVIIYGLLAAGTLLSALSYQALRRWSYPAVSMALLLIYVTAANHSPMARYLSVLVPVHLTLAWLAMRLPRLGGLCLAASCGLMCLITGLMVNGYVFY